MKIKSFFILLLACALLFAGCKVETDAPDSPASPAPSAAPTDFVLYRADSFRIGSQAYEKCSFNEDISKKYAALIGEAAAALAGETQVYCLVIPTAYGVLLPDDCGRCSVGAMLGLAHKYGCHFAVATGGTLARQMVKQARPKAIVAVACERDLTSGIQDVFPLPVLGVLNERPFGPCFNTRVDINKLEAAILAFMEDDEEETKHAEGTKSKLS